jgi:hypothetical protein
MMTNENELIVANVGDCRAVLCKRQTKSAVNVTHDQTPQLYVKRKFEIYDIIIAHNTTTTKKTCRQRERERIRSVGATIIAGSVFGVLSMTRVSVCVYVYVDYCSLQFYSLIFFVLFTYCIGFWRF